MRLIVFGATGATGRAVIDQAFASGHEVTAFVRSPDFEVANVRVVRGSVLDAAAVTEAIRGHDAVFSGLGTRPWKHEDICSQGTAVISAAMVAAGVKRLIVLSTLGVGGTSVGALATPFVKLLLGKSFRDKGVMESALVTTDLEWTAVRPGRLTNGGGRGAWRTDVGNQIVGGKISRADVAAFVLRELADRQFVRKAPTVVW